MSGAMYGYQDDSPQSVGNGLVFGLNAGTVKMTKFEWSNTAGKDGAEMEALVVSFMVDGADRAITMKKFPILKAFDTNGNEVLDPEHPVFKKAVSDQNAIITHIMHVFVAPETMQKSLKPTESFKEYCAILQSLLPKDYDKIPLDMFVQYQWQIGEGQNKTYLELPKKMSYGRWLSKAIAPVGKWMEIRKTNPSDSDLTALKYVDEAGNVHPFKRTGWFVNSKFAVQQTNESDGSVAEKWSQQSKEPLNPIQNQSGIEGASDVSVTEEVPQW